MISADTKMISIQVLGDLSLDGLFCDPQHHRPLQENMEMVAEVLGQCDIRVVNWESPLWGNGGVNTLKVPRLATTEAAACCILPLKLDVALLANNHVYDCLGDGFDATCSFLNSHNIAHLGASKVRQEASRPLVLDRKGQRIGILNYVGIETNPKLPEDATVFLNYIEKSRVLTEIQSLKETCNHILVFLHWGKDEHVRIPYPQQRKLGRSLIDAGASVVFGSHAHCLQGHESWKSGHIFYCMGNFLFSPLLSLPGRIYAPWDEDSRQVGVAAIELYPEKIGVKWKFFYQKSTSLLLQADNSPSRHRRIRKRSRILGLSEKALNRKYKIERVLSQLRYQIFCYGWLGTAGKFFNLNKLASLLKFIRDK
jgi:hypothetical protein